MHAATERAARCDDAPASCGGCGTLRHALWAAEAVDAEVQWTWRRSGRAGACGGGWQPGAPEAAVLVGSSSCPGATGAPSRPAAGLTHSSPSSALSLSPLPDGSGFTLGASTGTSESVPGPVLGGPHLVVVACLVVTAGGAAVAGGLAGALPGPHWGRGGRGGVARSRNAPPPTGKPLHRSSAYRGRTTAMMTLVMVLLPAAALRNLLGGADETPNGLSWCTRQWHQDQVIQGDHVANRDFACRDRFKSTASGKHPSH